MARTIRPGKRHGQRPERLTQLGMPGSGPVAVTSPRRDRPSPHRDHHVAGLLAGLDEAVRRDDLTERRLNHLLVPRSDEDGDVVAGGYFAGTGSSTTTAVSVDRRAA
jgi:hypothetical protein